MSSWMTIGSCKPCALISATRASNSAPSIRGKRSATGWSCSPAESERLCSESFGGRGSRSMNLLLRRHEYALVAGVLFENHDEKAHVIPPDGGVSAFGKKQTTLLSRHFSA